MNAKKPEDSKWIETMLSAHPAEVGGNGFTGQVMAKIKRQERKRILVLTPFFAAAFGLLFWFFPTGIFSGLGQDLETNFQVLVPYLVPGGAAMVLFLFSLFSEEVV